MKQEEFIYCEKCGSKMRADQRCCIKCGHINFLNRDNDTMGKYAEVARKEESESLLSNNRFISGGNSSNIFFADHAGNRTICLIINFIIYFVSLYFLYSYRASLLNLNLPIDNNCKLVLSFLLITYLWTFILSVQFLYMKANKKWYAPFIPIYNLYEWFNITMGNGWYFLLMLVPGVNLVFLLISFYNMGVRFKTNKFLSTLFMPFVCVYIALNTEVLYRDVKYVFNRDRERALSSEFKINRFIIRYLCVITLASCCIFAYYYYINNVMFIV